MEQDIVPEQKKMSTKEFREQGYLQELNRQFLHPLGLALEVEIGKDGEERFGMVWDGRDDPEGIIYGPDMINVEKAERILTEISSKTWSRMIVLGYVIQPLPYDKQKYHPVFSGKIQGGRGEQITLYKHVDSDSEFYILLPDDSFLALEPGAEVSTHFQSDTQHVYVQVKSQVWSGVARGDRLDLLKAEPR